MSSVRIFPVVARAMVAVTKRAVGRLISVILVGATVRPFATRFTHNSGDYFRFSYGVPYTGRYQDDRFVRKTTIVVLFMIRKFRCSLLCSYEYLCSRSFR